MSEPNDANKVIVRRFLEEIYRGNLAVFDELVAPDLVDRTVQAGSSLGFEARRRAIAAFQDAFPGFRFSIDDLFGEGDRVAARMTFQGAQAGSIFGIPPSGKHVTVSGILIARLRDGKIVETWLNYDVEGLLEQLGAAAPLGPPAG